MNASPKINLSAIMKGKDNVANTEKKSEEVIETPVITTEAENSSIENKPKVSLGAIRTSKSKMEINEDVTEEKEDEHESKKDELIETLEEFEDELEENIEEIESKKEKVGLKLEKIKIDSNIKKEPDEKTINKKEETVEEIEAKINDEVEKESKEKFNIKKDGNEGELFGNYQSDFIVKEKEIEKEVEEKKKNFKEKLKEPKTSIALVSTLIVLTAIGVSSLFYLDPENHSLNKYKTSILNNAKEFKQTYIDKPWLPETIKIETFSFNITSQEKRGGEKNYKYKEIIYTSKNDLLNVINNEVRIKKEEIARKEAEIAKIEEEKKKIEKEKIVKQKIRTVLLEKFKNLLLEKFG